MIKEICSGIISFSVVISTLVSAEDQNFNYHDESSGTFVSNVIDTNGDGIPGVTGTLRGYSSFGPVDITFYSEFDPLAAAPSESCQAPFVEFPLVSSKTVNRYFNGDLLYLETLEETFCADPTTGQFSWSETLAVIGGTGYFDGAKGQLRLSGEGQSLVVGADGATNFGASSMSSKGTIEFN